MTHKKHIVEVIGTGSFQWLSGKFNKESTLRDVPDEILYRVADVDITIRDYASDQNAITSIALITFAYKTADKTQEARFGARDILLLKVLAREEKSRREGKGSSTHRLWRAPLFELITGEVGDRIRAMRTLNSPV
ncbi:MAG: hypothetical protein SV775_06690 [Thermodesulfobacteriota bacterium]|nr:hypothetical protein [Thermodesulfobacteriota bacterium]